LNRVKGSTGRSKYLYTNYSRSVSPNPRVAEILLNSDGIVYGPTTLYASLIPTLMTAGIDRMISGAAGPKILVANLFRGNRSPPLNNLRHRVKFYVIIYVT
jgi:2-phospho-L-lactate transferase/gluconeogenesis factor (CofD/UPF0052 family)